MDVEKQRLMDELRERIQELEAADMRMKAEMSRIESEKSMLIKQLAEYSDERYEQDVLALVYEQRRGKK